MTPKIRGMQQEGSGEVNAEASWWEASAWKGCRGDGKSHHLPVSHRVLPDLAPVLAGTQHCPARGAVILSLVLLEVLFLSSQPCTGLTSHSPRCLVWIS